MPMDHPRPPDQCGYLPPFCDTNGDNHVSPVDALDVINSINAGLGGEGEDAATGGDLSDLIALLAQDCALPTQARRRLLTNAR